MDYTDVLPTPENYATPEQLKSAREYAKALMTGSGQQPVHNWTQGVSNMVAALVGGMTDWNAAQREKAAMGQLGKNYMPPDPNNPQQGVLPNAPQGGGASGPLSYSPPQGSGGNASNAISGIESGGNYNELGPVTKSGDRAYGKYQVMGENIPQWTAEAIGKSMTPDEYLNSPQAQEAVFKHKFGEYTQKYGPEGAARAWFAGEGNMNNPNARDQLGTTVAQYAQKFDRGMGMPSDAMAFNGNPTPPAEQAIEVAAAGKPAAPIIANPGMPNAQGQPVIQPGLVPRLPHFTREQVQAVLASPWASDAQKEMIRNEYMQQNQPINMPYMGGHVVINPNNPSQQMYIPDVKWGNSKVGDIEAQAPAYMDAHGNLIRPRVPQAPVGPQSNAGPMPGQTAPTGGVAPVAAPGNAVAENAPAGPESPANATATATPQPSPVQVASNDPLAGFQAAADKGGAPAEAQPNVAQQALQRFAQAAPPGVDPDQWEAEQRLLELKRKNAVDQAAQEKATEFAAKKYDTLSMQANTARKEIPNLEYALALTKDPRFHSGILSGPQDIVSRIKQGLLGDQFANAPNEVFDKLMSGTVLNNMRTALGGLGQVRLAEIGLLNKANANRNNTPASNRAVLELSLRANQMLDKVDQMGQMYASGDEVTDPVTGEVLLKANTNRNGEIEPRHGLDVGFDRLARKYINDHPTMTPEEIKHYETIFDTGVDPDHPELTAQPGQAQGTSPAQGGAPTPAVGATQQFSDGKGGTVTGVWDGQKWGPQK